MKTLVSLAIALAMAGSSVASYASGTILFSRPVDGMYQGNLMRIGSGLFTVRNDGSHLKQLTPWVANSYFLASGIAYYGAGGGKPSTGYWPTTNFSPHGYKIQYFAGESSDPTAVPYSGKYRVMDLRTGNSFSLLPGNDDNAAPGYGYLAWGPEASNLIAYTNSTSEIAVDPRCIYLMHTDGSARHLLWCAPAQQSTPQGLVPTLAVDSIRWAGNGQSLLAYVAYQPAPLEFARRLTPSANIGGSGYDALFKVDVLTGQATEIASNNPDPPSGDISFDGTKVVYQQYGAGSGCDNDNPESTNGISLCVQDLTTGQVTELDPTSQGAWGGMGAQGLSAFWYVSLLLSPDGSKLAFSMDNLDQSESDLYIMNTDGTGLRELTHRGTSTPAGTWVAWIPVAWSTDGTRILANRGTLSSSGYDGRRPSTIHILNLSTGKNRYITDGYAADWFEDTSY